MKFCVITLILLNPIMAIAGSLSFDEQANSDVIIVERDAIDVASDTTGIIRTGNSLAKELASINQPNLIAQQTRVQFFRQIFATPAVNLIGDQGLANGEVPAGNVSGLDMAGLETLGMDVGTAPTPLSVQKAAIDSLQNKLAGRKAPNPLMPLGSVATAFHLISNGVAKLMIGKLGAGHLPIYGDNGEVIGTRHATTGQLSAGRDRPQDQGQVWNNQG